jgi:hypothetical protein
MARCDQGYLCEVCGAEVDEIVDSDLYLGYIIGETPPEVLLTQPERHIRCNPFRAQFIVAEGFAPVSVEGAFGKTSLPADYVSEQEHLVTRGWLRLCEVVGLGLHFLEYPLPEVRARLVKEADEATP